MNDLKKTARPTREPKKAPGKPAPMRKEPPPTGKDSTAEQPRIVDPGPV